MKVMFFRIMIIYALCSFITLGLFSTKRLVLHVRDLDGTTKEINKPLIICLFCIFWPYALYMVHQSIKNKRDKED